MEYWISLTPFGIAFLPLVIVVVGLARRWLPALVCCSAVFQAASVVDIQLGDAEHGVTPYNVAALAVGAVLVVRIARERGVGRVVLPHATAISFMAAYAAIAVLGSFMLPQMFAGVPVHTLLSKWGFDVAPVQLMWTASNLVQAINLVAHGVVLSFLLHAAGRDGARPRAALFGMLAGLVIVVAVVAYEWLAHSFGWMTTERFWLSNPGYSLAYSETFMKMRRIFAPFSEPSYGSAFLAAALTGTLAVAAFGRHVCAAYLSAFGIGLALVGTFGTTGWVAAAIGALCLLIALSVAAACRRGTAPELLLRAALAWTLVGLASMIVFGAAIATDNLSRLQSVAEETVLKKDQSESGLFRSRSNEHALRVVRETLGLGAGLGSNRASSFLASLASNTGLPGLLLLLAVLAAIAWRYLRAQRLDDGQLWAIHATFGATVAVAIGIPDLNLPFYWVLLFIAVLQCPPPASARTK